MKKIIFSLLVIFSVSSLAISQNLEQGIKHLDLEQYERAKAIFKNLIKSESKKGKPNFYMGEVYLATDQPDSAKYFFMEGIKSEETEALNYVGMGQLTFEKNPTEGKRNFDKALELCKSKDAKVLGYIAQYYTTGKNKDWNQANLLLEKAIKVDAKNPEPLLLLGDLYLEKGDAGAAVQKYDQAMKLKANLPEAYVRKGKIYVRAKNYTLGLSNYEDGLKIDPNYPPLYREMGELYNKFGKYAKAIESYKKYISMTDKSYDTDFRYGQFLYQAKDYKSAVEVLSALKDKENSFYLYRMLAYAYYETGDYDKGAEYISKFWNKVPEQKVIAKDYEYQGKLYSKKGQDSLGIQNLTKAIELDSSKKELYSDIANVYMSKKRYKDAAITYSKYCANGNCKAQDYLNQGKAYYQDRQFGNADSSFKKLTEMSPTWANGYLWRAKVNHIQDPEIKIGSALPHYEKFIELSKADQEKYKTDLLEAYKYIGAYQMQVKKNKVAADAAWLKVKELNPNFKEVDEYLKAKY
ncbi:MAG: tetratricopeptide repeat protein [Cytophagales bacterium]|nr:MAG: tetratricopeptide repeat protein [Cytophagales bacterium]